MGPGSHQRGGAVVPSAALGGPAAARHGRRMSFETWLDAFFDSYYRLRPVNATFIGVHAYDDQLPDFSRDGLERMRAEATYLLSRLTEVGASAATASTQNDGKRSLGRTSTAESTHHVATSVREM